MSAPVNGPVVGTDTAYGYSISGDFPGGTVNDDVLAAAIESSGLPGFDGIIDIGDTCNIYFTAALSPADKTKLDNIVATTPETIFGTPPQVRSIVGITNDIGQTVSLTFTVDPGTEMLIDATAMARCTVAATLPGTAAVGDAYATENTFLVKNVGGVVTVFVPPASSRPPFLTSDASQDANTFTCTATGGPNSVTLTATELGVANTLAGLLWSLTTNVQTL